MAAHFPGRLWPILKNRFNNNLDPLIKRIPFTDDESRLIE
jgi:hypothetical protein